MTACGSKYLPETLVENFFCLDDKNATKQNLKTVLFCQDFADICISVQFLTLHNYIDKFIFRVSIRPHVCIMQWQEERSLIKYQGQKW